MNFNFIDIWYTFIVLWSPVYFSSSYGHLRGDFFGNKNTVLSKMYMNHSAVLKTIWLKSAVVFRVVHSLLYASPNILDYNSAPVSVENIPAHSINNFNFRYFYNKLYFILFI
jgi:hypothetical protein